MDLFGQLAYNNKVAKPIGSPIKELSELYAKKDEDYNYVVDTTNALDSALSNMSFREADRPLIEEARNKFKSTINQFTEEGDLENKVLDTKKLVNDLNNRYGLTAVQKDFQQEQAYIAEQKERLGKSAEDGGISYSDYNRAIARNNRRNKGVRKLDDGSFVSGFQGTNILPKYNFSEKVVETLKGFKANKVILTDPSGRQLVKDPNGSGYMIAGTHESVNEEDLVNAAKTYLSNDPDFKDRVQDDLSYELENMLVNPETGEKRQMTSEDLISTLGGKVSKEIANKFGTSSIEELTNKIQQQGGSIEDIYAAVRAEQMANSAIQLGVEKESYSKYEAKYLKDWQLAQQMEDASSKASATISNYGTLNTYETQDKVTSEDFTRTSAIYNQSKQNVDELENEFIILQRNNAHPDQLKLKQAEIDEQKRLVNISETRSKNVLQEVPEVEEGIDTIISNTPIDQTFNGTTLSVSPINGLDISKGSLENLVIQAYDGQLSEEDYKKYINISKEEYIIERAETELRGGILGQEKQIAPNTDLNALREAINTKDIDGIYNQLYDRAKEAFETGYQAEVNMNATSLKNKVNDLSEKLKNRINNNEISYTEEFKGYSLPEMSADERRGHPIAQLEHLTQEMTKNTNYHTALAHSGTNLDVKTYIEENYDVEEEDGEIDWSKGKLIPLLDKKADPTTGNYNNSIILQVPIGDKDNKKTIQIPVYTGEETYNLKANEALQSFQQSLVGRGNTLSASERKHLERTNLNLFNMTKYGKEMDLRNLNTMANRETVEVDVSDNQSAYIKAFDKASPQGMAYYLTDGKDENAKYWVENNQGVRKKMTEAELAASNNFKAIGGNSLYDVKTKIANMLFNSGTVNQKDFQTDLGNTVNLTDIFALDMKSDVTPLISKDKEPFVRSMKMNFPNLVLTDAIRPTNVDYGADSSKHKEASALDFRLNADAQKIVNLDDSQKKALGIKSAEIHDGNHVHVEFL